MQLTSQLLTKIQHQLDNIDIHSPKLAKLLCQFIPLSCPFERDIKFFGHVLFHFPPLCKVNPLYEQLVSLRFRAQCYLAEYSENQS